MSNNDIALENFPDMNAMMPVSTILSEQQLSELFDGIKDLIQSVAPDGHFLFVNRAWREVLGYTAEEVAALNVFSIIHPDHHAHCQQFMQRIMAGEDVELIEVPFLTKDGQVIVVEGNVSLYSINNIPIATRGIFRNITERKAVEAEILALKENLEYAMIQRTIELQTSEKRFRDLIASIPGAVFEFCIDAHGHRSLPFMSEGITDLIGHSPVECMANVEIVFQQICPDALPELEVSILDSQQNLLPWLYEYPVQTSTGEKWLRGYSIPHRKEDGSTHWQGVLVDITLSRSSG